MRSLRWVLPSLLGLGLLGTGAAEAGAVTPVVFGVSEGQAPAPGGGRVLVIYGASINKYTAYELQTTAGAVISPLTIQFKTKNLVALKLPDSLDRPAYTLPGSFLLKYLQGKTITGTIEVRITMGYAEASTVDASSLASGLRTDLDDAATLGGETISQVHEWARLTGVPSGFADNVDDTGTYTAGTGLSLSGTAFSLTFGGSGGDFGAATAAARSDHLHDARYFTKVQLNASGGTVNDAANPVDWSRIKGMPAGFADGIDDGGSGSYTAGAGLTLTGTTFSVNFAGIGSATTASKSDHNHDTSYYTQAQLNATGGTINSAGNPVDWTRMKGVPASFADGVDADTTYSAGSGLSLSTTTFNINWGGTGSAVTASRSDHNHGTTYLALTGGTLSGALTINNSGGQAIIATSGSSSTTAGGIDCVTSTGVGVAGHGDIGVLGDLDSDGLYGVEGRCMYKYQIGVYAYAYDKTSKAIRAYHWYGGYALEAASFAGVGVLGRSYFGAYGFGVAGALNNSKNGAALYGLVGNYYGDALRVNHSGYGGNLAVFQTYGSNYARISRKGTGYFNGGTYNYGADFAESVRVDRPAATFEPGDVMVIDPKAPRQFALSTEAESALVAGVVSTRPAVVGTTHRVALEGTAWKREEVKLGVVGIVPTKVCDEGGPVSIGDLLVTSSIPGHAKKAPANPAVGTVIGKALGALDRGRGKIEVLLMAR